MSTASRMGMWYEVGNVPKHRAWRGMTRCLGVRTLPTLEMFSVPVSMATGGDWLMAGGRFSVDSCRLVGDCRRMSEKNIYWMVREAVVKASDGTRDTASDHVRTFVRLLVCEVARRACDGVPSVVRDELAEQGATWA